MSTTVYHPTLDHVIQTLEDGVDVAPYLEAGWRRDRPNYGTTTVETPEQALAAAVPALDPTTAEPEAGAGAVPVSVEKDEDPEHGE